MRSSTCSCCFSRRSVDLTRSPRRHSAFPDVHLPIQRSAPPASPSTPEMGEAQEVRAAQRFSATYAAGSGSSKLMELVLWIAKKVRLRLGRCRRCIAISACSVVVSWGAVIVLAWAGPRFDVALVGAVVFGVFAGMLGLAHLGAFVVRQFLASSTGSQVASVDTTLGFVSSSPIAGRRRELVKRIAVPTSRRLSSGPTKQGHRSRVSGDPTAIPITHLSTGITVRTPRSGPPRGTNDLACAESVRLRVTQIADPVVSTGGEDASEASARRRAS